MSTKFSIVVLGVMFLTMLTIEADASRQRRQYTQSNDFQDFQPISDPIPNRPFRPRPNRPNRPNRPPPNENDCAFACAAVYEPVCAVVYNQRRTFSNSCYLDIERCRTQGNGQFLYRGECS